MALPADLTVRAPERPDLEGVVALIGACDATYREWAAAGWEPPGSEPELARWRDRFEQIGRWSRLALEPGGRVVALASWAPALGADDDLVHGLAHVGAVFVHPERWRQGIATALLVDAEAAMRAGGYVRADLWTPDRAPAEQLYRALGWRRDGRREWFPPLGLWVVGYEKPVA